MDFNILHLSDLHISFKTHTMKKLLNDIKEQIADIHDIVIAITGDIVDKGNYDPNTKTNVLNFFQDLKEILGDKFKSCFIVPGNHDKSQSTSGNILTDSFSKDTAPLSLEDVDWNYQLLAYDNFLDLEDTIYEALFSGDALIHPIHHVNTYGVEAYQSYESTIVFIKIDTSWCSRGGSKDKRKLRIAKSQLDSLTSEYKLKCKENRNKKIFTIALCHHPLNWLTENDESMLYSYLTNSDYLNTDVLLCGHTHDVDIQNLFSNTHQLTTFVTGIGWPEETPAEKRNGHRYSIYIFNLRRNSCEIIVRKTDLRGDFDIDRDYFPDKESKDKGKLSLPILPRNSHPFIKIPTCSQKKLLFTPHFIDNNILDNIKKYFNIMSTIRIQMAEFISQLNRNAIWDFDTSNDLKDKKQDILRDYFYNNTKDDNLKSIFSQNSSYIFDYFTSLPFEFCNWFVLQFKTFFHSDDDFRILFRFYHNNEYKQLCYQSKSNIEIRENKNRSANNKDILARNLKFDGIIEKSYIYKSPLVYSSNTWYNSFEPNRWKNFLCILPTFKNMELFSSKLTLEDGIPYILCTVSTKSEKNTNFLDILNYIGIKECISDIIESFVNIYQIDFSLYSNYIFEKKII